MKIITQHNLGDIVNFYVTKEDFFKNNSNIFICGNTTIRAITVLFSEDNEVYITGVVI